MRKWLDSFRDKNYTLAPKTHVHGTVLNNSKLLFSIYIVMLPSQYFLLFSHIYNAHSLSFSVYERNSRFLCSGNGHHLHNNNRRHIFHSSVNLCFKTQGQSKFRVCYFLEIAPCWLLQFSPNLRYLIFIVLLKFPSVWSLFVFRCYVTSHRAWLVRECKQRANGYCHNPTSSSEWTLCFKTFHSEDINKAITFINISSEIHFIKRYGRQSFLLWAPVASTALYFAVSLSIAEQLPW